MLRKFHKKYKQFSLGSVALLQLTFLEEGDLMLLRENESWPVYQLHVSILANYRFLVFVALP